MFSHLLIQLHTALCQQFYHLVTQRPALTVQASLMHEISEEPESDAERPLTMLDTLPEAKLPVVISQQQQPAAAVPPPLWEDTELE